MLIIQYTIPSTLPTNLAYISDSKFFLEARKCMYIERSTITNSISSKYPSSQHKLYCNQHYCQSTTNKITNNVITSVSHIQVILMFHSVAHIALMNPQHKWLATIHLLSDLATLILQLDNITKTCTKCY